MILESLLLQTKLFLQEDMGLEIVSMTQSALESQTLHLKQHTSMIGVGGTLNLMVVISFEEELLMELVDIFMDGDQIASCEINAIKESVTGEIINTILGLSLPTFPNRGKGITITPPVTIHDVSKLKKHKNSNILNVEIMTKFGAMSISAIGEK